ncbi:exosortase-associated protein EpsI, V-type [Sandarakinorhabdus sp.]|uniref:exosortase-associated protein EpsI, V-type n=1 Tax=Sandarakinorhabdus sp. TaxID=1916663 RepID=UPI0033420806
MTSPSRRDVIMGGALLAGAGGAFAMTPRGRLTLLLPGHDLETAVPKQIGAWRYAPSAGIVLPRDENGLAAKLYGQQLARTYFSDTRPPVVLVIAYGEVQSDSLQLHRPEVCYTAVGYAISVTERADIALAPGVMVPARQLVARNERQVETIIYWTRIGDDLPTSGSEQRLVKLRQQLDGYIADGILVRMSSPLESSPQVREQLCEFARELIKGASKRDLPALLGRPLAAAVS